jgi:uncharacterized OsmC-like protein
VRVGRTVAEYVVGVADLLRARGWACPVVAVSGTPTAEGAVTVPGVTEVCAGAYALQDTGMSAIGVCAPDDVAVSVIAGDPLAADVVLSSYPGPATPDGDGILRTRARTLRDGVTRIARDFRLKQRPFGSPCDDLPTPYESALAALGACVLITNINGYTARGITIGAMQISVRADLALDGCRPMDGVPLRNIRWHCEVDCDAPSETIRSVNRLVCAFSPNHRVFLDASPIEVIASVRRPDGGTDTIPVSWESVCPPPSPAATCPVEAEATWEYGSEAVYRTALTEDGGHARTGPFTVDQAKQILGIDKGPNSQEILLSALCGELADLIAAESIARTTATQPVVIPPGRMRHRNVDLERVGGQLRIIGGVVLYVHGSDPSIGPPQRTRQPRERQL